MQNADRGPVAKLEFPLPECREEFELAIHGVDFRAALCDLDAWLRNEIKHGSQHDKKALEAVRGHLHECLESHNVELYR